MFHKHIAVGKKPFLWISVLEWEKKEFDLVITSRVPSLGLVSNRPWSTNLYRVVVVQRQAVWYWYWF